MGDYCGARRIVNVNSEGAGIPVAMWPKCNLFANVNFAIQDAGCEIVAEREVVQFVGPFAGFLPNAQTVVLRRRAREPEFRNSVPSRGSNPGPLITKPL